MNKTPHHRVRFLVYRNYTRISKFNHRYWDTNCLISILQVAITVKKIKKENKKRCSIRKRYTIFYLPIRDERPRFFPLSFFPLFYVFSIRSLFSYFLQIERNSESAQSLRTSAFAIAFFLAPSSFFTSARTMNRGTDFRLYFTKIILRSFVAREKFRGKTHDD